MSDLTADQISAATLVALLALSFWVLERRWPITTTRRALEIGTAWVVLTALFEFGFGRYLDRKSWSELFENYNLAPATSGCSSLPGSGSAPPRCEPSATAERCFGGRKALQRELTKLNCYLARTTARGGGVAASQAKRLSVAACMRSRPPGTPTRSQRFR